MQETREPEPESDDEEVVAEKITVEEKATSSKPPSELRDTNLLPFPPRQRKPNVDEQFSKFVEVIRKLYVNIPLLDAMQVPTYAKYLKDILTNKKPLPSTEVIKLTEECSAAILNSPPEKRKDPGHPTIPCTIGTLHFQSALCDLGASVSVMPKVIFDKLKFNTLVPTAMSLQLADQTVCYPAEIAEDVPVRIGNFLVPVDFVVLDMEADTKTPLILGRPFLSTTNTNIDVGSGEILLNINGN